MILKVRYDYADGQQDWLYFSGFDRARFLTRRIPMTEVVTREDIDYVVGCDQESKSVSARVVEITLANGPYTIAFDSVAFLLNDSGRTVDTLTALNRGGEGTKL